MIGLTHLFKKTRISFDCNIEHKENIKIKVESLLNHNFEKLVFRTKRFKSYIF